MSLNIIEDRKMKDLIGRVGDDVSQLRSDISSLFSHTGRHALPQSARELQAQARERLHAGGDYAVSQLRYLRQHPGRSSMGFLGGLVLLGAASTGIYYLCKGKLPCCCSSSECPEDEADEGDK
jgi:hypothetical protein